MWSVINLDSDPAACGGGCEHMDCVFIIFTLDNIHVGS